jgi:hypothetical protein
MKIGQINIGSVSGDIITEMCKRDDVIDIVEIGTWNGMGSTLCVIKGIKESKISKNFVSLELYEDMFREALVNIGDDINFVNLLNGTIVSFEDSKWFDHSIIDKIINDGYDQMGISSAHSRLWYQKDMDNLKTANNVLSSMPDNIDFLILDGGEYTTYPEWLKLKDRTKIVALDDSNIFKCARIRDEILSSGEYITLYDNLSDRNGFSVFEKIKK